MEIWRDIQGILDEKRFKVDFIEKVTKVHSNGGEDERYIVISEISFYVFTTKLKQSREYYWINIKELRKIENIVTMKFAEEEKTFSFIDMNDIFSRIVNHLWRLLNESEFHKLKLKSFSNKLPIMLPCAFLFRLRHYLLQENILSIGNAFPSIVPKVIFESNNYELDTKDINEMTMRALFQALKSKTTLNTLTFNQSDHIDIWSLLSDSFVFDSCICHLEFNITSITDSFSEFSNRLIESKRNRLIALSFDNTAFTQSNMISVQNMMKSKQIRSFTFSSCLKSNMISNLVKNEHFPNVRYLSLKGSRSFNLSELSLRIGNLFLLSLANCGLEIGQILKELGSNPICNLRNLDLSKNIGKGVAGQSLFLPPCLIRITLDHTKWQAPDLIAMMKIISVHVPYSSKEGFGFSASRIELEEDCWQLVFNEILLLKFTNLVSIRWDDSPCAKEFFVFLKNNPQIKYLSISKCLNDDNIDDFASYLENNSTIIKLLARGNKQKKMVGCFDTVITSLRTCSNLSFVDFSYHFLDPMTLINMANALISSPKFNGCSIDGTNVQNLESWMTALEEFHKLKRPLRVSYPKDDIYRLTNEKEMAEFKEKLYKLQKYPPESNITIFDTVHTFYYFQREPNFPLYLHQEIEEKLILFTEPIPRNQFVSEPNESDESEIIVIQTNPNKKPNITVQDDRSESSIPIENISVILNDHENNKPNHSALSHIDNEISFNEPSVIEKHHEHVDWTFPLRKVPEMDNSLIASQLDQKYSLLEIINSLRSPK